LLLVRRFVSDEIGAREFQQIRWAFAGARKRPADDRRLNCAGERHAFDDASRKTATRSCVAISKHRSAPHPGVGKPLKAL
jgi:hypothetical protein